MKREITVEEFIRINDYVICAGDDWYGHSWCGVAEEAIDTLYISGDVVGIEYKVPYEDWIDTWTLPKIYFSMGDVEILTHAKAEYEAEQRAEEEWEHKQDMLTLTRLADKLGFELVKKEKVND
jgi:hypothetical protein